MIIICVVVYKLLSKNGLCKCCYLDLVYVYNVYVCLQIALSQVADVDHRLEIRETIVMKMLDELPPLVQQNTHYLSVIVLTNIKGLYTYSQFTNTRHHGRN